MAAEKETVRVTIRLPKGMYDGIMKSLTRSVRFEGSNVMRVRKFNEVVVELIWRGMADEEEVPDEKSQI